MTQIKGSSILPRLAYLETHGRPLDKKRVLDEISPEFANELRKNIFSNLWYPLELFAELCSAMDRVLARGDLALVREMGRVAAVDMLRTTYKSFTKRGDPRFLFQRASFVWNEFYDSGSLTAIEEGPKQMRVRVADFATPMREVCLSIQGWIEGSVGFSGAKNVLVEEVACRTHGDSSCDYLTTWE